MAFNCPNCQRALNDDARFCTRCGASVSAPGSAGGRESNPHAETVAVGGESLAGRVLDGKYKIVERLGAGGMGAVYRAERLHIGDEVAVKVLHPQFVSDAATVERFRREARAAAMLRHPNIVAIYDFGEAGRDAPAYIVMELVAGESMRGLLAREGALREERALALMREICAGVGAAHRRGIVHRDLKPDNIIILPAPSEDERETVKVVDFGIARLRDAAGSSALTQTGVIIGTPYYMAPEQCRGEHAETPADVYSLGAILYEMIAGAPPFNAPTPTGVIAKHMTEAPPPLTAANPALEAVVMRALAKAPEGRPPDALAFARELQAAFKAPAAPPAETPKHATAEAPSATSGEAPASSANASAPPANDAPPASAAAAATVASGSWPQRTAPQVSPETRVEPPLPRRPTGVTLVAVLGAVILLSVGVGALLRYGGGGTTRDENRAAVNVVAQSTPPADKQSGAALNENTKAATNENTRAAPSLNAGIPMNGNLTPIVKPSPAPSPPTGMPESSGPPKLPTTPGSYFVILGSFRKADERGKADARLALLRGKGYDVRLVDSDDQPRLTPGLWVVVLGPFAKSAADRWAAQLRAVAPEGAYVKAGR